MILIPYFLEFIKTWPNPPTSDSVFICYSIGLLREDLELKIGGKWYRARILKGIPAIVTPFKKNGERDKDWLNASPDFYWTTHEIVNTTVSKLKYSAIEVFCYNWKDLKSPKISVYYLLSIIFTPEKFYGINVNLPNYGCDWSLTHNRPFPIIASSKSEKPEDLIDNPSHERTKRLMQEICDKWSFLKPFPEG